MKLFDSIARRFDWRLVYSKDATICWTDEGNKVDRIFYYLQENGVGKRRCKIAVTGYCDTKDAKEHPYYLHKVKPWLLGQYDPQIPSYDSIKQKEFKDALRGRKT